MAWGTFLDERSVVGGDVSMVRVLLQHVDFQLNFLLFILQEQGKQKNDSDNPSVRLLWVISGLNMAS